MQKRGEPWTGERGTGVFRVGKLLAGHAKSDFRRGRGGGGEVATNNRLPRIEQKRKRTVNVIQTKRKNGAQHGCGRAKEG